MSFWHIDIGTAMRLLGFVYFVLPVAVWFVLNGKHPARNLQTWCGGAAVFGVGAALGAQQDPVRGFVQFYAGHALVIASYLLRVGALELEIGRNPRWGAKAVGLVFLCALMLGSALHSTRSHQLLYFPLMWLGAAWLTWSAWQVWRVARLPSARLITGAYCLLLAAGGLAIVQAVNSGGNMFLRGDQLGSVLTIATGLVTALLGSLGYVGMSIERSHRSDLTLAQELAREAAQRQAVEQHASQLQGWLDEREELVRLLAHEVRQPLNNAMAALHATHRALGAKDLDFGAISHRVRRAEGVLGQITGALDNTLAATALLASPDRVEPRDVDVDTVTALSIGDLAPDLRKRVQVHRVSQVRTATMDAGLMRLALRNLLSNAGNYTPPNTPIVLRVTDTEDPLGLVFAVIDQGPGIPPHLASQLFERGVRGQRDGGGHGLGLYVVRRVMELHGGTVDVSANPGGGAVFRLTLPQTDDAYSSPMPLDD